MKKDNFHRLKVQIQLVRDKRLRKPVVVESPKEIYKLVKGEIQRWDRERFLAVMLNARNGVIGIDEEETPQREALYPANSLFLFKPL